MASPTGSVRTVFRPLFVNEGALGTGVVGHPRVEDGIRDALADHDDVDPTFVRLPPMSRAARLASRGVPVLQGFDADLQRARWHAMQSGRARTAARAAMAARPVDALHVNSHSAGLRLGSVMRQVPTFLSVDATIRQWEHLGVWRSTRPWTDALLAPSYLAERRAFRAAAGVMAWTAWAGDGVLAECPEARVHVVHPGIDLERFRPAPLDERPHPRLLFVGGRFAEKGGMLMLDVLRSRLGTDLDLDVVTSDDVPDRPGVRVHRLTAASDELVRLFQQADLLCLPTRADAAPFAVVEAMASGTPVVSTKVGAIVELLGDGEAGLAVPPGDGRALADAIGALVDDEPRRRSMAVAARTRAEVRYDSRRQTAELIDLMRRG